MIEQPTLTPIKSGATCGWEMADKDGYAYPHGTKATTRVEGAREPYNGYFCTRHTRMAVEWSAKEARDEDEWN